MQRLPFWLPVLLLLHTTGFSGEQSGTPSPTTSPTGISIPEVLTITSVLELVSAKNPSLKACSTEVLRRKAALKQSGTLPNPELNAEIENFGGSLSPGGLDGSEITIGLSQQVELGGKRQKRIRIAEHEKKIAESELRLMQRELRAAAAESFIHVLVAQERLTLSTELLSIAEKTASAVSEKVEAGKISPIEKARARIELASARSDTIKAKHTLTAARRHLAGLWGDAHPRFLRVEGKLDCVSTLPEERSLEDALSHNPTLTQWESEIERYRAIRALEGAAPIPDLSVSAGIRNIRESGDNTFVAGISLPLPLFNRNRGSIKEAQLTLEKIELQRTAAESDLRSRFSDIREKLSSAYFDAVTVRDEILPLATTTYESTELGYREGKFDFMKMLDAQRTFFMIRKRFLASLEAYHLAAIEMEQITGTAINDCIGTNSKSTRIRTGNNE